MKGLFQWVKGLPDFGKAALAILMCVAVGGVIKASNETALNWTATGANLQVTQPTNSTGVARSMNFKVGIGTPVQTLTAYHGDGYVTGNWEIGGDLYLDGAIHPATSPVVKTVVDVTVSTATKTIDSSLGSVIRVTTPQTGSTGWRVVKGQVGQQLRLMNSFTNTNTLRLDDATSLALTGNLTLTGNAAHLGQFVDLQCTWAGSQSNGNGAIWSEVSASIN